MSYGGYNQGGYGQSNPYDQRGYQNMEENGHYNPDVEMQPLRNSTPAHAADPNAILNDCRDIDRSIDQLEASLQELQRLHRGFIAGNSTTAQDIQSNGDDIMASYRALGARVKKLKSQPESGNPRNAPQVGKVDRRLKKAINQYQTVESDFRKEVQEQQIRQYKIVRPEATDEEARLAAEDPNQQIFKQALLNSDRRGQAQSTLRAVEQRHNAIKEIERTIIELAQLFQDLDAVVVQQEAMIVNIEQKGEEVHDNMEKANVEISHAVTSARSARRKKWWCLLICILILIVVAIIVAVVVVVNKK